MTTSCLQVESVSEACGICNDVFVNKDDLLHHLSVMHSGQEIPSTSNTVLHNGNIVAAPQENDMVMVNEVSGSSQGKCI